MHLNELKTSYQTDEDIILTTSDLPLGTARVVARSARGRTWQADLGHENTVLAGLPVGTHVVEAWSADGALLAEEITTISPYPGYNPVLGFATSFDEASTGEVLWWLKALRCTVVQIYDWMESYAAPLPATDPYRDVLGRVASRRALRQLIGGITAFGGIPQAYAPVYAVGPRFGAKHPQLRLYRGDGQPESLGDLLAIVDPGRQDWQLHWLDNYGGAADALGFRAFHLDTYGYPRAALDAAGQPADLEASYASFVQAVRAAKPGVVLSFNQVNGVPRGFPPPSPPSFRYMEVWPPNDHWRHLEGLRGRSAGSGNWRGDTFAIYPPVWDGERSAALRTVVLSEAVVTSLGSNALLYGDRRGALRRPYYPDYERLGAEEAALALDWHRFALRCRDLFLDGEDTTWYEVGDENGAVSVEWDGAVRPEPVGGAVFTRVVRSANEITVSVLDLSGSAEGSWSEPTGPGRCRSTMVRALLDVPEKWEAAAAVLGRAGGRFAAVPFTVVPHREGYAAKVRLPVESGWSVLRLGREGPSLT